MAHSSGTGPSQAEPEDVSALRASAPCANEPEWLSLARDTVDAVSFQRGTRGVHVIGKDGRARVGLVNLFGCYAVDDVARRWAEFLGTDLGIFPVPTEGEAMQMAARGETWRDALAQAIEARRAETLGSVHESAVLKGCAQ